MKTLATFASKTSLYLFACVTIVLVATIRSASAADPGEVSAFNKTIGQWSADWWRWAVPNDAVNRLDCPEDSTQPSDKPVWFLAGCNSGLSGQCTVDRSCQVPVGRAIFFPIVNLAFANPNVGVPIKRAYLDEVLADREPNTLLPFPPKELSAWACRLDAKYDGTPLTILNVPIVRTQSPEFQFLDSAGVVDDKAISDGFWVIIPPNLLPTSGDSTHTLEITGSLCEVRQLTPTNKPLEKNPNRITVPFSVVNAKYNLTFK